MVWERGPSGPAPSIMRDSHDLFCYAGLDGSLELSSVCVVDAAGQIIREAKVGSKPEAPATFLTS
jgi:hypothetical protein